MLVCDSSRAADLHLQSVLLRYGADLLGVRVPVDAAERLTPQKNRSLRLLLLFTLLGT